MRRERGTGRRTAAILLGMLALGVGEAAAQSSGSPAGRSLALPKRSRRRGLGRRPDAGDLLAVGQSGGGLPGAGEGKESRDAAAKPGRRDRDEIALVNQRGLQFTPRVQAIALGQTVRFTNQDSETHNVHVVSLGLRVQPVDGAGTEPGLHAGAAGGDDPGVRRPQPHAGLRGRQPDALGPGLLAGGAVPAGGRPRRPIRAERLARDGRAVAEGDRGRGRQGGRVARAGAGRPVGAGPGRRRRDARPRGPGPR